MTSPGKARRAFVALALVAFAVRALQLLVEPAYLHPDALFQGLEPAFSLVWGHGIQTWEFQEGLRSWTWPGLLAGGMQVTRVLGLAGPEIGMDAAVTAARTITIGCDLVMVLFATRLAQAMGGPVAAVGTGVVLALHPALAVMGSQPLIDVPAAALLVFTSERALADPVLTRGRAAAVGLGAVTTLAIRIQLAPAVAVLGLFVAWQLRRDALRWSPAARQTLALGLLGGAAVHAFVDAITWGTPYGPVVAYLRYNLGEGQSAFGTMPATRYIVDAWHALGLVALLGVGLCWPGLRRAWPVALVLLAVAIPHQLVPYRVWRFVHPAVPLLIVLASVGLSTLAERFTPERRRVLLGIAGLIVAVEIGWASLREAPWSTTWLHERGGWTAIERSRGLNRAYLFLSAGPPPRRLGQGVLPAAAAPGYALLGHDIPIHPLLDEPIDARTSSEIDVWILPLQDGQPPPGAEVVWRDHLAGVTIVRRSGIETPGQGHP